MRLFFYENERRYRFGSEHSQLLFFLLLPAIAGHTAGICTQHSVSWQEWYQWSLRQQHLPASPWHPSVCRLEPHHFQPAFLLSLGTSCALVGNSPTDISWYVLSIVRFTRIKAVYGISCVQVRGAMCMEYWNIVFLRRWMEDCDFVPRSLGIFLAVKKSITWVKSVMRLHCVALCAATNCVAS